MMMVEPISSSSSSPVTGRLKAVSCLVSLQRTRSNRAEKVLGIILK